MKDLQKLLDPSLQQQTKNKSGWQWTYMDPEANIPPYYVPTGPDDQTLVFESRFESGNLGLAIKLSDDEYNLVLQNDTLSKGNTQCKKVHDI